MPMDNPRETMKTDELKDSVILVIDDNPRNLGVVVELLTLQGLKCLTGRDGEAGITRAVMAQPDLILLDIVMPGIDGIETCRRLKSEKATRDIPVIFMTALTDAEEKVKGFEAGCVDYVTKPIEGTELIARIRTHLTIYRLRNKLETVNEGLEQRVLERTDELAQNNIKLRQEVAERKRAEEELSKHREHLEVLVEERTRELKRSNLDLQVALKSLKRTQKHLVESEKMASLAQLVMGIAHEVNTPLGIGITGSSAQKDRIGDLQLRYRNGTISRQKFEAFLDSAAHMEEMILKNLMRAGELIQHFKQIAVDPSSGSRKRFNLKEVIQSAMDHLKPQLESKKLLISVVCGEELELSSYPGAISQIITNLMTNSLLHAFGENGNGEIRVDVETSGENTVLRYSDNGKGIPENHQNKIFDPFFTTKRGQGGMGLGLHIVYNLITQQLGGRIHCKSREGEGTTFIMTLPDNPAQTALQGYDKDTGDVTRKTPGGAVDH